MTMKKGCVTMTAGGQDSSSSRRQRTHPEDWNHLWCLDIHHLPHPPGANAGKLFLLLRRHSTSGKIHTVGFGIVWAIGCLKL